MFLKVWNLFIELEDYKFYVQNFEFWSFGENLHIFKPISINVYHPAPAPPHPPYLNEQLRHTRYWNFWKRSTHPFEKEVATMSLLFLLL